MAKGGKGGSSNDNSALMAQMQEAQRQARISAGTDAINSTFDKQFTPDFYAKQAKGYEDYAMPQLRDQYANQQKQLTYNLARTGNLDSSGRASQEADLSKALQSNEQQVAATGQNMANQSRGAVETARTNLVNSLNATGNAEGAANNAATQATALAAQPAYSPIGDMFSTFTGALGQQANLEKMAAMFPGAVTPQYNTGLFGYSGRAVKGS